MQPVAPAGMWLNVTTDLTVLELGPPVRASSNVWPLEGASGKALRRTLMLEGPRVEQARGTRSAVASGTAAGRACERVGVAWPGQICLLSSHVFRVSFRTWLLQLALDSKDEYI